MSRILIVDDKEENRYYLEALLRGHGHQTECAGNGADALELARRNAPDVVISDLLMPVMDGYSLLRHWKADPKLRKVPFIVYTATYTEPEDERLALDLGADAFILKPAEPQEFLAWLREVLSRPPAQGPIAAPPARADEADLLRTYSETLIRKLEEKSLQLEEANRRMLHDIERREAAEAALRISEERFRLLAKATNDAVWDWDLCAGSRWWGAGFADLFGHEADGAPAARGAWAELIHPQDRERVLAGLKQAIDQGIDTWTARYRLRRADGSWAQVEDRGLLLRNEAGEPIRMVGGMSDVSARLQLEERLRASQRMESIGQLTGGVAHDFNNLLTVVMGSAESLLAEFALAPPARTLVETTLAAAQRGADLTRRLLTFARRQPLSQQAVPLRRLVVDIEPLLRRLLGGQVSLSIACADDGLSAWTDPAQLEQAVLNLCANARDAMPNGGELRIGIARERLDPQQATLQQLDAGEYAVLSVADSGEGIEPELLSRVFEPFFTTKPEGRGTGLGLAMVYGLARQSSGSVTVASQPGCGSEFRLYLPIAPTDAGAAAAEQAAPSPARAAGCTACTVLLVEDDESVRQLTRSQLESLGHTVLEAAEGAQALVVLQGDATVDLLLSDVMMPRMTGPQLAAQALRVRPGLRVLFVSGNAPDSIAIETRPVLSVPVLAKPYRRDQLSEALRAALA